MPAGMRGRGLAWLAGLVCLLCLAACAKTVPVGQEHSAAEVWRTFQARPAAVAMGEDFLLKASLYYTAKDKSNRTTLAFWGRLGGPLRLDVQAGMGAMMGMYREDGEGWLGFYPQDKKAFRHLDAQRALPDLGVDIPFSLQEFASLLTGRMADLLPKTYAAAEPRPGVGHAYRLDGPRFRQVVVDFQGRVVGLAGVGTKQWTMTLADYDEDRPAFPAQRLDMTVVPDAQAKLLLKSLERRTSPWTTQAMALEVPPGIPVEQLR